VFFGDFAGAGFVHERADVVAAVFDAHGLVGVAESAVVWVDGDDVAAGPVQQQLEVASLVHTFTDPYRLMKASSSGS